MLNSNPKMKHTFVEFYSKFVIFLEDEYHVSPTSFIKSACKYLFLHFSINKIDSKLLRDILYTLRTEGRNGKKIGKSTLNKYIQVAKYMDRYFEYNLLADFRGYRNVESKKEKIIMSDKQMKAIAECYVSKPGCVKHSEYELAYNHKFKTIFQLLRFSGMPPDDVCCLTWSNYHGTHLSVYRNKTGKKRIVPLPEFVSKMFDQMERYDNEYIFGSARGKLKPATINLELKKRLKKLKMNESITAYNFRYSFDTLCALGGGEATLPQIAKISGHSISTMYKYYLQYDVQNLADALDSSHPGLRKYQSIDAMKRVAIEVLKKIVDMSKYNIHLEITYKEKHTREITLS